MLSVVRVVHPELRLDTMSSHVVHVLCSLSVSLWLVLPLLLGSVAVDRASAHEGLHIEQGEYTSSHTKPEGTTASGDPEGRRDSGIWRRRRRRRKTSTNIVPSPRVPPVGLGELEARSFDVCSKRDRLEEETTNTLRGNVRGKRGQRMRRIAEEGTEDLLEGGEGRGRGLGDLDKRGRRGALETAQPATMPAASVRE